jgi:hypothetical protein
MEDQMTTTDCVKVRIDLDRVALNLRTPDGGTVGEGTARSFLRYVGFQLTDDGTWVGPRSGLCRLNYSEIVGVESLAS